MPTMEKALSKENEQLHETIRQLYERLGTTLKERGEARATAREVAHAFRTGMALDPHVLERALGYPTESE